MASVKAFKVYLSFGIHFRSEYEIKGAGQMKRRRVIFSRTIICRLVGALMPRRKLLKLQHLVF